MLVVRCGRQQAARFHRQPHIFDSRVQTPSGSRRGYAPTGEGNRLPWSYGATGAVGRVAVRTRAVLRTGSLHELGYRGTMNAIRAARAFTRRHKIAKIEGGYNGSWDDVMVSTHPSGEQAGDVLRPVAAPGSQGLTPDGIDNVVVLPFNEVEAAEQLIEQQGEHLAAVIVEPVMGSAGMIPAEQSYLEMLREVTERLGVLLVFDEVISFRVAYGGA